MVSKSPNLTATVQVALEVISSIGYLFHGLSTPALAIVLATDRIHAVYLSPTISVDALHLLLRFKFACRASCQAATTS